MLIYLTLLDTEEEISKFELIYNTYKNTMYYIAQNILNDNYLSEDAVHEAFLRIINNLDKIEKVDSKKTKGLVLIIVKNIAIDIYRKNKKEREQFTLSNDLEKYDDCIEYDRNDLDDLEIAISKLPQNYKQVFILKYAHDMTDVEIGQVLNIKTDNVRKRISRGKEKLRNILSEMGVNNIG